MKASLFKRALVCFSSNKQKYVKAILYHLSIKTSSKILIIVKTIQDKAKNSSHLENIPFGFLHCQPRFFRSTLILYVFFSNIFLSGPLLCIKTIPFGFLPCQPVFFSIYILSFYTWFFPNIFLLGPFLCIKNTPFGFCYIF